jgi:hypothetical protein
MRRSFKGCQLFSESYPKCIESRFLGLVVRASNVGLLLSRPAQDADIPCCSSDISKASEGLDISSSMDPHLTPGPSSLSYFPALSPTYDEPDDSASRSQARSHLGIIQRNELDESLNIRGSTLRPTHPSPLYGKLFCLR